MRLHDNYLLVDFIWAWISRMWLWLSISPLYSVTSRNVSSVSFSLCVNLISLWIWLILVFFYFRPKLQQYHWGHCFVGCTSFAGRIIIGDHWDSIHSWIVYSNLDMENNQAISYRPFSSSSSLNILHMQTHKLCLVASLYEIAVTATLGECITNELMAITKSNTCFVIAS